MDIRLIYYMVIYSQLIYSCPWGMGSVSDAVKKIVCNSQIETKYKAPISRKQDAIKEINEAGGSAVLVEISGVRHKTIPLKLKYAE